jgi:2-iminobutanoate/2-iminopropanoate deaminase
MNKKIEKEILLGPATDKSVVSGAVAFGSLVFFSGKVGRNAKTKDIEKGDIYKQTVQTFENIKSNMERVGLSMNNALKVTVFLLDMKHFSKMNEAYKQYFPDGYPARSCVEVSGLPDPEALIEIELIAGR